MFDILLRIFNYFGITRNSPTPSNPTLSNPTLSNQTPSNLPLVPITTTPSNPITTTPSNPITSLAKKKPPKTPPKKDNIVL